MEKKRGDMEYVQGVVRFVEFASLYAHDGRSYVLVPNV